MGTMVEAADATMPTSRRGAGGLTGRGSGCLSSGDGSRITSQGQSSSWQQSKRNVKNIVNKFLKTTPERQALAGPPATMDSITAEQACNQQLYEEFAGYLANEYICTRGTSQYLKVNPAVCYLNLFALELSNKYKHTSDATRLFFTCKDVKAYTDSWVWFNGVRTNMKGVIFERAIKRGEQMDASAPPIYPSHVDEICAAFSKEGSADAAIARLDVLTTLYGGARPGETQYIALTGMSQDDHFNVTLGEDNMIKTGKTKIFSICASFKRDRSWHLALGDYLVLVKRQDICPYAPVDGGVDQDQLDETQALPDALSFWLIPELQRVDCPGTWLGNKMKEVLPVERGGSSK